MKEERGGGTDQRRRRRTSIVRIEKITKNIR